MDPDRLLPSASECVQFCLSIEMRDKNTTLSVDNQIEQATAIVILMCPILVVHRETREKIETLNGQMDPDRLLPASTSCVPFYLSTERHSPYCRAE